MRVYNKPVSCVSLGKFEGWGGGGQSSKGGLLFDLDCGDLGHLCVQKLQRLPRLSAECDLGYGNWTVIMTNCCSS